MAIEQQGLIPLSDTERAVALLTTEPVDAFAFESIFEASLSDAAKAKTDPVLPQAFAAAIAAIDDETLATVYAEACDTIEHVTAPLNWTKDVVRAELGRRMEERRPEATSTVQIPHPRVDISSTPEWSPYEYDVDQILEGLRGLPEDEIEKLLRTEPAREVSIYNLSDSQRAAIGVAIELLKKMPQRYALIGPTLETLLETHTIPESVTVRNASTLQAWLKKNPGTRATIVAAGVKRTRTGTKVVLKPKTPLKLVAPIAPAVAIEHGGA